MVVVRPSLRGELVERPWINRVAARSGVMAARGLDGGVGRLPADDRRPRCADVCMPATTCRQRRAGARVRRARCPLSLCAKPTKRPRSQQAMGAVRRCLRTHADHLGNREADSGHGVRFTAKTATQSRWSCPRTSWPSILRNSSGPSRGRPADDRPGSFGSDCQKTNQEIEGKPPEFGSMSQLGALAEWLRSGLQSRLHQFDSGRRLSCDPLCHFG